MAEVAALVALKESYEIIHKHLLKSMNACAIVLSILLTTSYSGFLQPPKPLDNHSQVNSSIFQKLFIYFNGAAFFTSVVGLLFFGSSSFSPLLALDTNTTQSADSTEIVAAERETEKRLGLLANLLPKFFYIVVFLGLSLTSSVLAYIFAGFSTVRRSRTEQAAVIVPAVVGGFVYLQALAVCITDTCQLVENSLRPNEKLWKAMTDGTMFGRCLAIYVGYACGDSAIRASGDEADNAAQ